MEYLEYVILIWQYLPYVFYTFVFLTLMPKSLKKINDFARADYEANRHKYHRCYAPGNCCHSLDGDTLPKQKTRKAVTRVYPKKQAVKKEHQSQAAPAAVCSEEPSNIYKRQVHTHTNVNKIAKMFESGGVQKKINRVTPTVLPDFRRCSLDLDDEMFERKDVLCGMDEGTFKKDNVALSRLSKQSQELEENNENSSNAINQMSVGNLQEDLNSSWRSEPITAQRRKRHIPMPLTYNNGENSGTPSTMSPAHLSPLSSPELPSSPVQQFAPLLNMKSSLEDIFAAIAKSAENADNILYRGCTSLSPVTSIDDILSQRRLSRPLSAYSISDLLNDESNAKGMDEAYMENFLIALNKT